MRTTVVIPDPLLKKTKMLAIERSTTFRALVIEGLEHVLSKAGPPSVPAAKLPATPERDQATAAIPAPAPVQPTASGSAASNTDIHSLIDAG